jgi:hypothetical protein
MRIVDARRDEGGGGDRRMRMPSHITSRASIILWPVNENELKIASRRLCFTKTEKPRVMHKNKFGYEFYGYIL